MNVKRAISLHKQGLQANKKQSYCPLLHLLTLLTAFQTKKIASFQGKIEESIAQLSELNIKDISSSSLSSLLETYHLHLMGNQNVIKIIQILCQKANKIPVQNPEIFIKLFEILIEQYQNKGQKDNEIRTLFSAFQLGLSLKKKIVNTFNYGVKACEMVSKKQFQKKANVVIAAIRNEIESNNHILQRNISLASQVYGSKIITKESSKKSLKQNNNDNVKKLIQRSSSKHRNFSQHRPSSPNHFLNPKQGQSMCYSQLLKKNNNPSSYGDFGQNQQQRGSQMYEKQPKTLYSKTVHKEGQNNIVMSFKTQNKSKIQLLPFYILLYEIYVICLLRISPQIKRRYYEQAKNEIKDRIVREYPGRNIEQVLFDIEVEKIRVQESRNEQSKKQKIISPSISLKKMKNLSSSAGKLSLNSPKSGNNSVKDKEEIKSTYSYQIGEFQQQSNSKIIHKNDNILGNKLKVKPSKFNQQGRNSGRKITNHLQSEENGQSNHISYQKMQKQNQQDHTNQSNQAKQIITESKDHFRTRLLSSKSEHKLSKKQISDRNQNEKKVFYNINRSKKEDNKGSIFQRLKWSENREKVNLKKKEKKLIEQKNLLKLNEFSKSSNHSERSKTDQEHLKTIVVDEMVEDKSLQCEFKEIEQQIVKIDGKNGDDIKQQVLDGIQKQQQSCREEIVADRVEEQVVDRVAIVDINRGDKVGMQSEIYNLQQVEQVNYEEKKCPLINDEKHQQSPCQEQSIDLSSILNQYFHDCLGDNIISQVIQQQSQPQDQNSNVTQRQESQKQLQAQTTEQKVLEQPYDQSDALLIENKLEQEIGHKLDHIEDKIRSTVDGQRLEQSQYKIKIRETPSMGHQLYSTERVNLVMNNNMNINEDKKPSQFVTIITNEEYFDRDVDFLKVPCDSDEEIGQKIMSQKSDSEIEFDHKFSRTKQVEVSIGSESDDYNEWQIEDQQVRQYLQSIYSTHAEERMVSGSHYGCSRKASEGSIQGQNNNKCDEQGQVIKQNELTDSQINKIIGEYIAFLQSQILSNPKIESGNKININQKAIASDGSQSSSKSYFDNQSSQLLPVSGQTLNKDLTQFAEDILNVDDYPNTNILTNRYEIESVEYKYDQGLNIDNNICSILNATFMQYSETSKLNITEFSPVVPPKKFTEALQSQKDQISILSNQGEEIIDIQPTQNRNSIENDINDMAELVKNNFINSNHLLGSNISIEINKNTPKMEPILKNKENLSNRQQSYEKKAGSQMELKKKKNVQISPFVRQQTIESNISSKQQSHSIIIAHHLLKPQIHVSETTVKLTVFHPQEKKSCQIQKQFEQPIVVKDYMKGFQARITKFLDKLISQAKNQQKMVSHSTFMNGSGMKRSKKQQLQRSIVEDLLNHGHKHPFNWEYIVSNIDRVDLEQQLFNLKTIKIPYGKNQSLTISLMHYTDYKRLIVEYRKNPLELRPVQISLELNQSIFQITNLFNQKNVKIELTEFNNQIKPILQVYNIWCHLQTSTISLKNSNSKFKSLFKLNQFVFKQNQDTTKYNMLIQMVHNESQKSNLIISDLNLHDRNKLVNNFSVVVGYSVKIDKGKSRFIVAGNQVKSFLQML